MLDGGCSLTEWFGTTHDTAGSVPVRAAPTRLLIDWMLASLPSERASSKPAIGFQMLGVFASCGAGTQFSASGLSQSGSLPVNT